MKLEPPTMVRDVYRDMRDRRLIWIALALVIAIVAVPVLLGGSAAEPVSTAGDSAAVVAPIDGIEQIDPVVLTEVPGLRDFQERLKRYQSRNPFKQQLVAPEVTEAAGGGGGGSVDGSLQVEPVADPIAGSSTSTSDPSVIQPTVEEAPVEPVPVDPGEPTDRGDDAVTELITYRLDVRVGPVGDTKVLDDVKSLSILPDRRNAIVQYVESDIDGEAASFIVSPDAIALKGDGKCGPTRANCQFLLMKAGDDQEFQYGPDGRVYRLELLDINRHVEPVRSGADAGKRVKPGYDAETGLSTVSGGWAVEAKPAGYGPAP